MQFVDATDDMRKATGRATTNLKAGVVDGGTTCNRAAGGATSEPASFAIDADVAAVGTTSTASSLALLHKGTKSNV